MKEVIFLLPYSTGDRLREDGFLDALLENDIDYSVKKFGSSPMDLSRRYAYELSKYGCDLIIYPELKSSIFLWESANRDWFRPERDEVGIANFLEFLEESGSKLLPMPMQYGPFDDFELTFYGHPSSFAKFVNKKIDEMRNINPNF